MIDRTWIGFALRRPWVTRYQIGGRSYGGTVSFDNDERILAFAARFPPDQVRRVLDLGSLEGGQTFQLAARYEHVVGVEVRSGNLRRARYVQRHLGIRNVEFVRGDLEDDLTLPALGRFDAVFCSGLLYHLPEPWRLLEQLPQVAPRLLLWTHFSPGGGATVHGFDGHWFEELEPSRNLTSGVSPRSFWLTKGALVRLLEDSYGTVEIIRVDETHPNGPAMTVAAGS